MAWYIENRAANCTEGLEKQRQLYKLANDVASCRNHLLFKDHFGEGKIRLSQMKSCKRALSCPLCAFARANKNVAAYHAKTLQLVRDHAEHGVTLRAWFITLTVKNGVNLEQTYGHFTRSVTRLVDRYGDAQKAKRGQAAFQYALNGQMASVVAGLFSAEVKRGSRLGLWHPHTHGLLLSTGTIDEARLSEEWFGITGDSFIVKVIEIPTDDVKSLVEICKYALTFAELTLEDNFEVATVLKHKKLLRSFGEFRGLKLDDNIDIDDASVLDSPYTELLYRYTGGVYATTRTGSPTPLLPLSVYGVDPSGSIITAATIPPPVPYRPATIFSPLPRTDCTPEPTTPATAFPGASDPSSHHHEVDTMLLRQGRFPIEKGTFTIDGQSYLLCQREHKTKAATFYLLTLPGRGYLSALWPRSGGRYSLDYKGTDGAERVFEVSFAEPGFITLTDKGLSHRSLRPGPWQQGPRSRSGPK